jgi:bifunctional NMN adenylyltransferase/nudix hydrolase
MKNFDLSVYIGRFQPFHNAHLEIVKEALKISDKLLIVIGSRNVGRRTFRNPWTSAERREMILRSLKKAGMVTSQVYITSVFDVPNDDDAWREQVQEEINRIIQKDYYDNFSSIDQPDPKVTLIGYEKDASSYYLQTFPRLVYSPVAVPENVRTLNATDIRKMILNGLPNSFWEKAVPEGAREFLQDWLQTHRLPEE